MRFFRNINNNKQYVPIDSLEVSNQLVKASLDDDEEIHTLIHVKYFDRNKNIALGCSHHKIFCFVWDKKDKKLMHFTLLHRNCINRFKQIIPINDFENLEFKSIFPLAHGERIVLVAQKKRDEIYFIQFRCNYHKNRGLNTIYYSCYYQINTFVSFISQCFDEEKILFGTLAGTVNLLWFRINNISLEMNHPHVNNQMIINIKVIDSNPHQLIYAVSTHYEITKWVLKNTRIPEKIWNYSVKNNELLYKNFCILDDYIIVFCRRGRYINDGNYETYLLIIHKNEGVLHSERLFSTLGPLYSRPPWYTIADTRRKNRAFLFDADRQIQCLQVEEKQANITEEFTLLEPLDGFWETWGVGASGIMDVYTNNHSLFIVSHCGATKMSLHTNNVKCYSYLSLLPFTLTAPVLASTFLDTNYLLLINGFQQAVVVNTVFKPLNNEMKIFLFGSLPPKNALPPPSPIYHSFFHSNLFELELLKEIDSYLDTESTSAFKDTKPTSTAKEVFLSHKIR